MRFLEKHWFERRSEGEYSSQSIFFYVFFDGEYLVGGGGKTRVPSPSLGTCYNAVCFLLEANFPTQIDKTTRRMTHKPGNWTMTQRDSENDMNLYIFFMTNQVR